MTVAEEFVLGKWNTVTKSTLFVMGITAFSLIFSFIKEAIFANYYGASNITDAYSIAIQIPVILFSVISMAISNVVLPYYSKKLHNEGSVSAGKYISNLMTTITIITVVVVLVLECFPSIVISIFAPGMANETQEIAETLFRLVLPTIVFTELMNINTAVQDVHKSFIFPQLGSIILNTIFVTSIVMLEGSWGIYAAVVGTIIGTVIEFVYSVFLRRKFVKYRWFFDISDRDMVSSLKKSIPVIIGIGIDQINNTIDTMVSSLLKAGSISMIGYASKLSSAIGSLLITAIVKVTYPEYAECAARNDDKGMADCLMFSSKIIFLLLTPVVCGGVLLSKEIVSIVFFRGAFDISALVGTAPIFTAYIVCLVFSALRQTLAKVFYSYGDTKTPMVNGVIGLVVNTILDLSLYKVFGAAGIAWATTGTFISITLVLAIKVKKRNEYVHYRNLVSLLLRVMVATAVMIAFILCLRTFCMDAGIYNLVNTKQNLLFLLISIITGAIIYIGVLFLLKTREVIDIATDILRRKK